MRQCLGILQSLPTSITNNLRHPRTPDCGVKQPQTFFPMPLSHSPFTYLHPVSFSFLLLPFWFPRHLYVSCAPNCQLPPPNPAPHVPAHAPVLLLLLWLLQPLFPVSPHFFPDPSPLDHNCCFPVPLATGDQLVSSASPLPCDQH